MPRAIGALVLLPAVVATTVRTSLPSRVAAVGQASGPFRKRARPDSKCFWFRGDKATRFSSVLLSVVFGALQ